MVDAVHPPTPCRCGNFGSQVDDTPSCAQAWSIGIKSGDPDRVKDGVRDCGAPTLPP